MQRQSNRGRIRLKRKGCQRQRRKQRPKPAEEEASGGRQSKGRSEQNGSKDGKLYCVTEHYIQ